MNDAQSPNFRGVRVALGTGDNPVKGKGNWRASRNGRVRDLPPENPNNNDRTFASLYIPHVSCIVHPQGSRDGSEADLSEGAPATYSRKDKSLGLLCENFLNLYGSNTHELISLDAAATQVGTGLTSGDHWSRNREPSNPVPRSGGAEGGTRLRPS